MLIDRLRDKAAERRRVGWEVTDVMTPSEMEVVANRLDAMELALHQIAGNGNITGRRAREIASDALGIKLSD